MGGPDVKFDVARVARSRTDPVEHSGLADRRATHRVDGGSTAKLREHGGADKHRGPISMPKETAAFIVLFGTVIGVLWTFFASIFIVDREIPPITSLSGAATWLLLWPGYLTWAGAGLLVVNGIPAPNIWLLMLVVGLALGGLMSCAGFYWATKN